MTFFPSVYLDILWESGDFKDWLLVPGWGDYVGPGLLLDPLDGGPLGPNHQPDHPVGHPNLYRGLPGLVGYQMTERQGRVHIGLTRSTDLRRHKQFIRNQGFSVHILKSVWHSIIKYQHGPASLKTVKNLVKLTWETNLILINRSAAP